MDKWSKEWMKHIDGSKLTPYPIQLANCDRLENNDAVYIFDEVGSGKTISSGLMALHYLYNHRDEAEKQRQQGKQTVLIITTDAVKKSKQFEYDWIGKLPFGEFGFYMRPERRGEDDSVEWNYVWPDRLQTPPNPSIDVINHLHSDLRYESPTHRYGLVVIDEAHIFLKSASSNAKRYRYLTEQVWTEKVVFLTATPFSENSESDLQKYVEIAGLITMPPAEREKLKNDVRSWQSWQLDTVKVKTGQLMGQLAVETDRDDSVICARFNPASPVTRYFKDTIRAMQGMEGEKEEGVRALAHVWQYSDRGSREEQKKSVMLQKMEKALTEDPSSRFIVFVRFKDESNPQGAHAIGRFLEEHGWSRWLSANPGARDQNKRYYAVVTGDEGDLSAFQGEKGCDDVPHVLIMTYQMGEAGVNLPGFNYVVNYHIPGNPAALEQRFGRVDRLKGQRHPRIHICYLVSSVYDGSDANSRNFHNAQTLYMQDMLTALPARNILLTRNTLKRYRNDRLLHEQAEAHISRKIGSDAQLKALLDKKKEEVDSVLWSFATDLDYYEERLQKIQSCKTNIAEIIIELRQLLKNGLNEFRQSADDKTIAVFENALQNEDEDRDADGIFYMDKENTLHTQSPEVCANVICESNVYHEYRNDLRPYLALPELLAKHPGLLLRLEQIYIFRLQNGKFDEILGYDPLCRAAGSAAHQYGVWPDFQNMTTYLSSRQLSPKDCDFLNENVGIIKEKLPFSHLCDVLADHNLHRENEEDDNSWRERLFRSVYTKMLFLAERSGIKSQGMHFGKPVAYPGSWWPTPQFDSQYEFHLSNFWRYTNDWPRPHRFPGWDLDWKKMLEQLYDYLRKRE